MRTTTNKYENYEIEDALLAEHKHHHILINSAQATLTDLDRTIMELSDLVSNLKRQSDKITL